MCELHELPMKTLCEHFDQPHQLPIRGQERRWLATLSQHNLSTSVGQGRVYETGPKQAPTVLLIHGWGGYAGMFAPLANQLVSRGYRVVVPDLLGHGEAASVGARHFGAQRIWLTQILHKLGPCQHVVGHSLGGLLATLLPVSAGRRSTTLLGAPQSLTHAFQHFVDQLPLSTSTGLANRLAGWYCAEHDLPIDCLPHHSGGYAEHVLFVHGSKDHRFSSDQARANHSRCPLPRQQKQLLIGEHLGHLGILYHDEIHHTICTFIDHAQESSHAM